MEKQIRRGGVKTPEGFIFEFSGGDLSLDFVNTVDVRPTDHPNELLPTYTECFSWAHQAGLITRMQELNLMKKASRNPREAESARKYAIAMRECLFQILSQKIERKEIPKSLLEKWNKYVQRTMDYYELVPGKEGFEWRCIADPLEFDSFLWPVIHSAVQLLTGSDADRIRRCAQDYCDWLFLDESKRGNRRWCDMSICGNRAKAERFYSKKRRTK
ncbi:MAG TPA: CGNR zinc finger domain-containing protein [Acidobacteriota bacterium]|nr:CGNR zinc finger domain-containing protein [Acidobacteriota bacterium]